ncbi:MAG: hypothetical protein KJ957_08480, partial [Candidatus Omnitrophica bacterium]|nr:hypothetical protein [Candidatus Omnitrophota bacterium]
MKRFYSFIVVFVGILFFSNVSLNAAIIESVGGETGDRSWDNTDIWEGGIVPNSADTVIIN